ncbi:HNH endonuclease [Peribacillus sp. JNUCC41]|uniref:HNH endonuclease n=1 Tax=Peribacillus sp. JNUCC41 TaxID=2778370 RepID=UPI00177D3113|nr:HNH endonuclease signature motif containing protein [Brevibacillus sp. JNUCC-41]QOS89237.1 HNH endonuclease [Brevibacillus sp. JNUCC-41]
MEFICQECGKKFIKGYSTAKFCSNECRFKGVSKINRKLSDKECEYCKKVFRPKSSRTRFCSVKCRPANRENKIQTNCLKCGKEMHIIPARLKDGRGKYCSKKCFASRTGETNCKHCGNKLTLYLSDIKENNFCDQKCKNEWMSYTFNGENAPSWRGGCDNYRGENWKSQRRKALKRDGHKCVQCGIPESEAKLMVHHKIPFRFFNGNYEKANILENLETNCNSCHSSQQSHLWHQVPEKFQCFL